ncbi:EFR1 family ferrodoxin [Clostridium sp. 'deep sea']|uniref:EFR1 family ferrodoxin n=1 Tax=Clostridium sp. 'deep sea' TaxID=2779445 RepID=UPI001896445D|nr:EFR1 family ferrodoxin [Clostridium sp. 'deep sea']QOR35486.1 EFR1 family ferrodoxin [Clostridium sp. 'deep sea']
MFKNIKLFYYSGTGNTKYVTEMIASEFSKKQVHTELINIEDIVNKDLKIEFKETDLIGISHPVIAFATPKIMIRFINKMPKALNKVFIYKTAADPSKLNNYASEFLINHLNFKGYTITCDELFVMPCNFIIEYKASLIKQLIVKAENKAKVLVSNLIQHKTQYSKDNKWYKSLILKVNKLEQEKGALRFSKSLKVNSNCNLCQKCVSSCPTQNIVLSNNKIAFLDKCEMCMRCLYSCNQKAITTKYKFMVLKNGYSINTIKAIKKNDVIEANYIHSKTKGYYKHFKKYLLDS